jgi:hypothetical protein
MSTDVPTFFKEEVEYHLSNGYKIESVSEDKIVMHKKVRPSVASIGFYIVLAIMMPPILVLYLLFPAIPFNYFKGYKYRLELINADGDLKVLLGDYRRAWRQI